MAAGGAPGGHRAAGVSGPTPPQAPGGLPHAERVLVVCAHPDDESFGLGAVIAAMADGGTEVGLLCYTRGELSTLGATTDGLAAVRAEELAAAAAVLGVTAPVLLDRPDGSLAGVPVEELVGDVERHLGRFPADALLVFDEGGVTGHPDHGAATAAAVVAADRHDLAVIAWTVPDAVASALNAEFGTAFVGRPAGDIDVAVDVDRARQLRAVACHVSQSTDNPVLWRRLALLGDTEHLRYLRRAGRPRPPSAAGRGARP